jgi:hypothetical protein
MRRLPRPLAASLLLPVSLAVGCDPPPADGGEVPDCTQDVEVDTTTAAAFLGSLACAWPLIVEDRSPTRSLDTMLTHGLVYAVEIANDGVTIPADDGELVFPGGNTDFEDGDTVTATLAAAPRQVTVAFEKATSALSIVLSDSATQGNYRLAQEPPPSPLLATGTYSDLTPMATTFSGTIDFAAAFDVETQPVEPRIAACGPMSFTVQSGGIIDVDLDGTAVTFPYRPRRTTITQFENGGTEITQLAHNEPDGRRLALEVTRPAGSSDAFTLQAISVQVAEGDGVVAEYTQRPTESPCN